MQFSRSMTNASQTVVEKTGNLDAPPSTGPDAKVQDAAVSSTKHTVLVIDDDAGFLHLVSSVLRKHGFEVLNATSGLKGLNMLGSEPDVIRVVLLDYSMPKLDGGETLKFVRQLAPKAKVIGVTAMKLDSIAKPYLDGVDWLLTKPVIATELVSAVNALLGVGQTTSSVTQS
jgi:CheY-like chemotaxis protein